MDYDIYYDYDRKIHCLTSEFHVKFQAVNFSALANKRQGRTRLNLRQLYLYLVLVFTFVFKLFKQASHYLNDNSGILSVRISSYFPKI